MWPSWMLGAPSFWSTMVGRFLATATAPRATRAWRPEQTIFPFAARPPRGIPLARNALVGIEAVLDGRLPEFRLEYPCHAPSRPRWYLMTVTPLDPNERMGAVISHTKITARVVAELERQASDARFRAIYEHAPVGIAELTRGARWSRVNDHFCRIVGYESRELESKLARDFTHPDDLEREAAQFEALRAGRAESASIEKRVRRKDGCYLWVRATTSCARAADGDIDYFIVVTEDISERKLAEQRQRTLTHEVAHRGRNLLAIIQSLASRSLMGDISLKQARESFEGRLQALSNTFGALTSSGARLEAVLNNELSAFGARARCEGPHVVLTMQAVQDFAMVVHELATNASKHGALSTPDGRVDVSWSVEGDRLRFLWREEGGPTVKAPERRDSDRR